MGNERLIKISLACASLLSGFLMAQYQDVGATLMGENATSGSRQFLSPGSFYCAAYEFYGDGSSSVIVGNPAEGENPVHIFKRLNANYRNGTSAVLRVFNATFLVPREYDINATQYCLSINGTRNGTVAATGPISSEVSSLAFKFNSDVANGTLVQLGVCDSNGTYLANSTMLRLSSGLRVDCNRNADIRIEWDAPFDCMNATLISLRARHIVRAHWDVTTELNAEDGFRTFLYWDPSNPHLLQGATIRLGCIAWSDYARPYCLNFGKDVNATGTTWVANNTILPIPLERMTVGGLSAFNDLGCIEWVLGRGYDARRDGIISFRFNVVSSNPQPNDVTVQLVMRGPGNNIRPFNCRPAGDGRTWTCETDCVPCPSCSGEHPDELRIIVRADGGDKSPAIWTVSNFTITRVCTDAKFKAACCGVQEGVIGFWYGGLEAIVPFVRLDEERGFYTTIKFSSRYHKDVRVYAIPMIPPQRRLEPHIHTNFGNTTAPWMLKPVTQVGVITTTNSTITITARELFERLNVPSDLRREGIPVKFVFGVPNLQTCYADAERQFNYQPSGFPFTAICPLNHADPMIEGYAAYDTPKGTRRIPIKFKSFKQGAYSE